MASATVQTPDNFFRILHGIQYVICEALSSLDDCIRSWHTNQIRTNGLLPCSSPDICSAIGDPTKRSRSRFRCLPLTKSDSRKSACQNCIKWTKAVKSVLYLTRKERFEIVWENIDTTRLYPYHTEVCNGFIRFLQPDPKRTKLEDYDIGSVLQIMRRFGDYHFQNVHTTKAELDRMISQVTFWLNQGGK